MAWTVDRETMADRPVSFVFSDGALCCHGLWLLRLLWLWWLQLLLLL